MTGFLQNKTLVAVLLVAVLGVGGFLMYSWTSPSLPDTTTPVDPDAQQLLIELSNLDNIHLDGAVFTNPVFVSLTDYGVVIPSLPFGRRNPFLPIGRGGSTAAATTTTTKSTH
jgi:hypothetical protein